MNKTSKKEYELLKDGQKPDFFRVVTDNQSRNMPADDARRILKDSLLVINNQDVLSYTLVPDDAGNLVNMTSTADNTIIVPLSGFDIGAELILVQSGAGTTTIQPAPGVTVNARSGALEFTLQYAAVSLIKLADNSWLAVGDMV